MPLRGAAAQLPERAALLARLDAFSDGLEPERTGQLDGGADDGFGLRRAAHHGHEQQDETGQQPNLYPFVLFLPRSATIDRPRRSRYGLPPPGHLQLALPPPTRVDGTRGGTAVGRRTIRRIGRMES